MGDFNAISLTPVLKNFIETHSLYCHIRQPTCWKSSEGRCIDLILSNCKHSFQHTGVAETGLSDHHGLMFTMLKIKFQKLAPKTADNDIDFHVTVEIDDVYANFLVVKVCSSFQGDQIFLTFAFKNISKFSRRGTSLEQIIQMRMLQSGN